MSNDSLLNLVINNNVFIVAQSQAQELETVRANNSGFSIGTASKEAKLLEAADIQLKMGQIERYCEIMLELGHVSIMSFS